MAVTPLAGTWPLVGRGAEMSVLRACLHKPLPAGLLLTGSIGVGKSRLLSELADLAAAGGFWVEWVVGGACGGSVPLAAMGQLVRECPDGEMDPARFLIACRELVLGRCGGRRLFLAVDDVPSIDAASLDLFTQLVVLGYGLVAFTARSEDPLPAPVASLCKDQLITELEVAPLTGSATEELVRRVLGSGADHAVVRSLAEMSEGNPLFLRELVAEGMESERLRRVGGVWEMEPAPGISSELRRLVSSRLESLTPAEHEALEVLSVSAPLELAAIGALSGTPAVEALERRHVVRVSAEGRRRLVGFRHPLYAEVVLDDVPATARAAICGRLIDAVVGAGARRRDDPLRLARWHLNSGWPVGAGLLLAAASQALVAEDYPLAEGIADAALAAGAGDEATLIRAGAIAHLGRPEQAEQLLAGLQASTSNEVLRARAAAERAHIAHMLQADTPRAVRILEAARETPSDPRSRMIISGDLIMLRAFATSEPSRALEEALALADNDGAPDDARLQAITVAQLLALWLGRLPLSRQLAARGRQLAQTAAPTSREIQARLSIADAGAQAYDGHLPEAIAQLSDGYHRGLRPPMDGYAAVWGIHLALALAIGGRLDEAADIARQALGLTPIGDVRMNLGNHAALAAVVAGQAHDLPGLRSALDVVNEAADSVPPRRAWKPMARAWEAFHSGDDLHAAALAGHAADNAMQDGNALTAAWACRHALEFGHPEGVAELLQEIVGHTSAVAVRTWAAHAAALAESDAARLEMVADEYRDRQEYLHAVQAYVQAAGLLQHRRERPAAARSMAKAQAIAITADQVRVWLPPEQLAYLTPREVQIAAQAASGLASREIAERLFISVRTVDNHLAAIYTKLGIHHRTDLLPLLTPGRPNTDQAG